MMGVDKAYPFATSVQEERHVVDMGGAEEDFSRLRQLLGP